VVEKYFNLLGILPAIFWLLIVLAIGIIIRNKNIHKPHYRYFIPNLLAKIIFSLLFAAVYIFIYEGGDTVAYYDGANVLNNLLLKDFDTYWFVMFNDFNNSHYTIYYDLSTGYPPGWIFREPEGFFVSKLMSFFSFFTLRSYLAMTIIMAFFSSLASWKLFELARSYKLNNEKLLAFGILFLPSVNFWCAGVSKDSVVFIAALILIYNTFLIISSEKNATPKNYIYAIISGFIIYKVRSFILAAILLPMLFSIASRVVKAMGGTDFIVASIRTLVLLIGIFIGGRTLVTTGEEDFIKQNALIAEAAVIQKDFQENTSYGDKKYDIGLEEFTPLGLLRSTPFAILAGLYRPYIWEVRSPTLVLNGLESILFIYFTFLLFKSKFLEKWRKIRAHEFLIFCLIFIMIIAFMTGLTSGLYGVLVRLRSILLPFMFILLTVEFDRIASKSTSNGEIQES
jgi:hypothetical protein